MKNIFFLIFFKKILRNTCWPPALEHGGHLDPRTPCHILCPPASETHKGGSTHLEKAGRSKHPQEPEGRKEVKGMERTRALERTICTSQRWWKSKMPCAWHGLMSIKSKKKDTVTAYKHVCMYVHTCLKNDFKACDTCWRLYMKLRTRMLPGWRAGCSCEQAGSLAMPKEGNWAHERWSQSCFMLIIHENKRNIENYTKI